MIVPSVVISEKHMDATEITEHPVQRGAAISDHAYDRPSEVTMELGFAGGGSLIDMFDLGTGASLGKSPKEVYQQLLALKASKKPFDVTTGKRMYKNMLIRAIEVTTDKTSENVLMVTLTLREVIIVETQTAPVTAPPERMKYPLDTSGVADKGTKTPIVPKENKSILVQTKEGGENFFGDILGRILR
ncbi:putative bacteriophage protein [Xenorhabdus poinarii G6]|uniref:Putative bacteriophage protein n=2 Tax=Xenorhabdus poinarii TaxID=40577 RepID=A0A068R3K2_9GAMM|nr:putative bacteriophage protein [Xenorhabdus poinarii G6]